MGRPLSDKFWNDPTRPGFQLTLDEAWLRGEVAPVSNVKVLKQLGTRKYIVRNPVTSNEDVVFLRPSPLDVPGQAYKSVYPWTGVGSGATIAAPRFQVIHVSIATGGSGYAVGNTLTVVGGTGTSATLTVTSVSSMGTITGASILNSGDYSTLPTLLTNNPVTGGAGSGASVNIVMGLRSAAVGSGGSGYVNGPYAMAMVSGSNGEGAVLLGTVAGGAVTSWNLIGHGYGFTNVAVTAQVFGVGPVEFARTILASRVKTWGGGSYVWAKNKAATKFGEAVLVIS